MKEIPIYEIVVGPGLKRAKVVESVKYSSERDQMENSADKVCTFDIPYMDV